MWAKYLLTCCCIRASFKFDMQHKHVLRKLNFYLLTPSSGSGGVGGVGGGGVGSLGQNICYHVAAFVILFNLICSMTVFEKVEFGPFDHIPKVHPGGETQAFDRNSRLISFIFIVPLSACEISVKDIDNELSYCERIIDGLGLIRLFF